MLKRILVLLTAISMLLISLYTNTSSVAPVRAQGAERLEYGASVEGEISNEQYEIAYTFTGKKKDLVAVQMYAVRGNGSNVLSTPTVLVLDAKNRIVADSTKTYGFGGLIALVVATLKSDGDYSIIATRREGRSGDSAGKFMLTLFKVPLLVADQEVSGTAESDGNPRASAILAVESKDDFNITLTITDGDFSPNLNVFWFEDNGQVKKVASAVGSEIIGSSLTLRGNQKTNIITIDDFDSYGYPDNKASADFKVVMSVYSPE